MGSCAAPSPVLADVRAPYAYAGPYGSSAGVTHYPYVAGGAYYPVAPFAYAGPRRPWFSRGPGRGRGWGRGRGQGWRW